jgi:outer membrane immunogenic protein
VAAAYNWTGCSVGGNIGGIFGSSAWTDKEPGDVNYGMSEGSHSPTGISGGVQEGCDYQFANNLVVGLQGDFNLTNLKGSHTDLIDGPGTVDKSKTKWFASVTPRVGYAFDRFLPYVKGGIAFESLDMSWTDGTIVGTAKQNRTGWTVGVGGEYALMKNVTMFVEYNYLDFGNKNVTFANSDSTTWTSGIKDKKSVVKAGLNWRF